jgi:hypothetical protein
VNLVKFVTNSKFDISRFFGFENDEQEVHKGDYMIDKQEAINSVKNYEIAIESDYLFNQVRFKKTNTISLKSLEDAFPIWSRMA